VALQSKDGSFAQATKVSGIVLALIKKPVSCDGWDIHDSEKVLK